MRAPTRTSGPVAVVATVVLAAAACSTAAPDDSPPAGPSPSTAATGPVVARVPAPTSPAYPRGTRSEKITYTSSTGAGDPVEVTGLVLVPPGSPPDGGWPLIAWGHGTTGIGDSCAPSDVAGAYYDDTLGHYLDTGYAVVATDYEGLGTPGTHPYLMADSEARSMVDMVQAVQDTDTDIADRWVAVGHSQGGQAAWAVAESMADREGPGDYRGAAALAPAPNFSPTLDYPLGGDPLVQQFYLMLLVGLSTQQDLDLADYLAADALAAIPATETLCFDDLTRDVAARGLADSEFDFRTTEAKTELADKLRPHEIGRDPIRGPLLVQQGLADTVVPPDMTAGMVDELRRTGADVEYGVYPGATHGGVLDDSQTRLDGWMGERLGS